jgi:WD40 repeat protein
MYDVPKDDLIGPPGSVAGGSPSDIGRTLRQTDEALAESLDLSLPKDVEQHATAPKISGYVLTAPIGQGAYAQVWKAWQVRTGRMVAIKVFTQAGGANWVFLQREVERMVKLDKHPNVVSLLDADLAGAVPYYVMELMEAGSLERHVDPAKPLPVGKVVGWMEEMASALAYVHAKGVIHCDLKPANVLEDEGGHARVVDFGQARAVTDSSGALGTLFYMAPEQAQVAREGEMLQPDVRWDVYALGATIYALLTGKAPHGDTLQSRLNTSPALEERLKIYRELTQREAAPSLVAETKGLVDEDLAAIVGKCLEAVPEKRYGSVGAVLADLAARRQRRPVGPLAHNRGYRSRRFVQRNAVAVVIAFVAVLALAGSFVQIVRKQGELTHQLAYTYILRGRQLSERGDMASAAAYFAESNRIVPSRLAMLNTIAHLQATAKPVHVFEHSHWVRKSVFNRDGTRIATAGEDRMARIWDTATGRPVGEPMKADGAILDVAFSYDGRFLATAGNIGPATIWDAGSASVAGKPIADIAGAPLAVAFSPDGRYLATGSTLGRAAIWDTRTREMTCKPLLHRIRAACVAFHPRGDILATGGDDKVVRLWKVPSGEPAAKDIQAGGIVNDLRFSMDGKYLAVSGQTGALIVCDARTGQVIGRPARYENAVWRSVIFPDSSRIVAGSWDRTARMWSLPAVEPVASMMRHSGNVWALDVSPDGQRILTGSDDCTARLWDSRTGFPVGKIMMHEGSIQEARFSPDGRYLLTGSFDNTARLWDRADVEGVERSLPCPSGASVAAFSPDGGCILTAEYGGPARLWDAATLRQVGGDLGHGDWIGISAARFSPDGKTAITVGWDYSVRVWSVKDGRPAGKGLGPLAPWAYCILAPDANHALVVDASLDARVMDIRTGKVVGDPMKIGMGYVFAGFAPGSDKVITSKTDGTFMFWDAGTGKALKGPVKTGTGIASLAFPKSGMFAAVTLFEGAVQLWDMERMEPAGKPFVHPDGVRGSVMSEDGRLVLTGGYDMTARLWDARRGVEIGEPMRHPGWVEVVAISDDGRYLATGCFDSCVRIWDAETCELLGTTRQCKVLPNSLSFSPDGRTLLVGLYAEEVRLYDTGWLYESVDSGELMRRTAAIAHRRIGRNGNIEVIPLGEWRKLAADSGASRQ